MRNLLSKGIFGLGFVWFTLCGLMASLSCERPYHEPYGDEIVLESIYRPVNGAFAEVFTDLLFTRKGFFKCPSKHTGDHGVDGLYTLFSGEDLITVLCETKFRKKTTRLDLGVSRCSGCIRGEETRECYQMSRRWAFNAIDRIRTESPDYCTDFEQQAYCSAFCPLVRDHILTEEGIYTAIRVAIVYSAEGRVRLHVLGATNREGVRKRDADIRAGQGIWSSLWDFLMLVAEK